MRNQAAAVLTALVLAAPASAGAATFTTYTDANAFAAALSASALEDFNDNAFTPGWSALDCSGCTVNFSSGKFTSRVGPDGVTMFRFASAINAWGGNFDMSPGGFGRGLIFAMRLDDGFSTAVLPGHIEQFSGQFYGFISDTPFIRVTIGPGPNLAFITETFTFDNMRFGTAALQAAIPEPATWAMMITGFGAAGAMLRRRRSAALGVRA